MQEVVKTQVSKQKLNDIDQIRRNRQPPLSRWKWLQEAIDEKLALEKEIYRHDRNSKHTTPHPTTN